MTDSVFVSGLVLHAYHGVAEHEARVGQSFIIDLTIEMDLSEAARSDRLADTASYDDVVDTVRTAFLAQRYRLVEAAAGAVADAVLARFPHANGVSITVHKPHAPIAATFQNVGVTLVRKRNG